MTKKTNYSPFSPNVYTRGRASVKDLKTCIHVIGTQRVNKMISILINIIQHEKYLFSFQAHVSAACSFLVCSKSHHIMLKFHVSSSGQQ